MQSMEIWEIWRFCERSDDLTTWFDLVVLVGSIWLSSDLRGPRPWGLRVTMEKCYWATHGYTRARIFTCAHIFPSNLTCIERSDTHTQRYIYIYTWKTVWTFFFVHYGFYQQRTCFFVQLRILVFDCEGLFKSFDNTGFGHPPTVSKRGISVRSGANWESWSGTHGRPNLATNTAIFPTKFGCTHKIPVFFQHHVGKKQ